MSSLGKFIAMKYAKPAFLNKIKIFPYYHGNTSIENKDILLFYNQNRSMNKEVPSVKNNVSVLINGAKLWFPNVWLRDNCQCNHCFHKDSQSRIIDWKQFDVNVVANKISIYSNSLLIEWEDGHISEYSNNWLLERSFDPEQQRKYLSSMYRPEKKLWTGNDFSDIFHEFQYDTLLQNDQHLYNWLQDLAVYGITSIKNVPPSENSIRRLIDRVGFIKKTHYGEEFFVEAKPNTSNVAYLSSNLQLHTDLPYYEYTPGVTFLHCVVQTKSKGGENLVSDCFYIADLLKRNFPKQYKLLTETLVDWTDVGKESDIPFHSIHRAPVICEDINGNIIRVNHSTPQRGSHLTASLENVKHWYASLKLFVDLIHEHSASFKLNVGQIFVFDNVRLTHGRTKYEDTKGNSRRLVGAYLDWDEIYSRLRYLKN